MWRSLAIGSPAKTYQNSCCRPRRVLSEIFCNRRAIGRHDDMVIMHLAGMRDDEEISNFLGCGNAAEAVDVELGNVECFEIEGLPKTVQCRCSWPTGGQGSVRV
jgi:hypothetical protein